MSNENEDLTFEELVEQEMSNVEKLAEGKCGAKKKMKEEEDEDMETDASDEEVEDEDGKE